MELQINGDSMVKDIQVAFSKAYPYLKIEFFRHPHSQRKSSPKTEKIDSRERVKGLAKISDHGNIDIDGKRTVLQLEKDFWEMFGLSAQVSRKSHGLWIETSLTDDWTLEQQNTQGELFNKIPEEKSLADRIDDDRLDAT